MNMIILITVKSNTQVSMRTFATRAFKRSKSRTIRSSRYSAPQRSYDTDPQTPPPSEVTPRLMKMGNVLSGSPSHKPRGRDVSAVAFLEYPTNYRRTKPLKPTD